MKVIQADRIDSLADYIETAASIPQPRPGQVRVRVAAVGVGYVDALVALGRYQVKPAVPHTPGTEIAGVVDAIGEGVTAFRPGDRVFGLGARGFAELAVLSVATTIKLPDSVTFAQGAAAPLNGLTALHGLADRGAVRAGETLLVLGAAGGVGSAAIQLGKILGAQVIAAASTAEKRAFAIAQGADDTIDTSPDGWRDRLKVALGGDSLNVIFDPVCGPLFEPAFRSLGWGGRHLVVGFVGGPIPALGANLTLMKGAALTGVDVRQFMLFEAAKAHEHLETLGAWASSGRFVPPVGQTFAWANFGEALTFALSGKGLGKTVLRVDDDL